MTPLRQANKEEMLFVSFADTSPENGGCPRFLKCFRHSLSIRHQFNFWFKTLSWSASHSGFSPSSEGGIIHGTPIYLFMGNAKSPTSSSLMLGFRIFPWIESKKICNRASANPWRSGCTGIPFVDCAAWNTNLYSQFGSHYPVIDAALSQKLAKGFGVAWIFFSLQRI